jgi:hypothetical protein
VTQLDSQRAGRRWRRGRALLDRVQTSQSPSSSTWQGNADPGRSHRPSLAESDGPLRTSADDMWLLTHGLRGRRGSCEPRCLRPFAARRGCSARRHVTACPTTAESERWVGHGSRIARTRGGFAGFAFSLLPRDADRSCAHRSSLPKLFHSHAPKCGDASVPGQIHDERPQTSAGQRSPGARRTRRGYPKGWSPWCLQRGLIRVTLENTRRGITRRVKGTSSSRFESHCDFFEFALLPFFA